MKIRLATAKIQKDSIVDGEGIRTVIWTQGCIHNCYGCHNPETHSLKGGYLIDLNDIIKKISQLEAQDGITFSGGDPMLQPEPCSLIAAHCKELSLNIWCYTGYTYETLIEMSKKNPHIMSFLKNIDVLVDGKFILEKRSLDLNFKGSTNQRIIDVPKSLKENKICLVEKYTTKNDYNKINKRDRYMYI